MSKKIKFKYFHRVVRNAVIDICVTFFLPMLTEASNKKREKQKKNMK